MFSTDDKEDSTDFDDVNKKTFQQIKNKAVKIGYSDGVNDGRKREFQNGFDQGYKDGLTTSFNIEKFRSFFYNLKADEISKDLIKEKKEYETLLIADLKPLLLRQQGLNISLQEHIDETFLKFEQKVPVSTNLLNAQSCSKKL